MQLYSSILEPHQQNVPLTNTSLLKKQIGNTKPVSTDF